MVLPYAFVLCCCPTERDMETYPTVCIWAALYVSWRAVELLVLLGLNESWSCQHAICRYQSVCSTAMGVFSGSRASYCEIYNEALYDLLRFSKQQLSVRWDAQRGFHAPDLAVKDCASVEDLIQVGRAAHACRAALNGALLLLAYSSAALHQIRVPLQQSPCSLVASLHGTGALPHPTHAPQQLVQVTCRVAGAGHQQGHA